MTFAASLGTRLRNYAGLTALVGTRIYAVRAPDNVASPYVVYSVSIQAENTIEASSPLDQATIMVDAYSTGTGTASGYDEAHDVAAQVRAALNLLRGALTSGGVASEGSEVLKIEDGDMPSFGLFKVSTTVEMFYQPS